MTNIHFRGSLSEKIFKIKLDIDFYYAIIAIAYCIIGLEIMHGK